MSDDPSTFSPSDDEGSITFTDEQEPAVRAFYAEIERLRSEVERLRANQRTPGTIEVCAKCQTPDFMNGFYNSGDVRAENCPIRVLSGGK